MQDRSDKTTEFKGFLNNIQDKFIEDIFPALVQKALLLTGLDRLPKTEQEARKVFVNEALKPINELIDNVFNDIEMPVGLDKDEMLDELKAVAKRYLSGICDKHILEFLTFAERKAYKQKRPTLIKSYGYHQKEANTFLNDSLRKKLNNKWQEHIKEMKGRLELRETIGHFTLLGLIAIGLSAGLIILVAKMVETIIDNYSNPENGICVDVTPPFATTAFFLIFVAIPFAKALHEGFPLAFAPAKPLSFTVYPPSQLYAIREEIERKIKKMFLAAQQKASQKEAVPFRLNTSQTIELQAIVPYEFNKPTDAVSEKEEPSQSKVKSKTTALVRSNATAARSDSSEVSCSTSQPASFIRCEGQLNVYETLMRNDKFDKIMKTHKELEEPVMHALEKTEDRGKILPSNSEGKSGLKRLSADKCELKLKGLDARLFFSYKFKEAQIVLSNPRLGKHSK